MSKVCHSEVEQKVLYLQQRGIRYQQNTCFSVTDHKLSMRRGLLLGKQGRTKQVSPLKIFSRSTRILTSKTIETKASNSMDAMKIAPLVEKN